MPEFRRLQQRPRPEQRGAVPRRHLQRSYWSVPLSPRDYNPVTQQWMEQDPIGFAAGDSNLKRFVGNDPINAVDPSGLIQAGQPSQIVPKVEINGDQRNPQANGATPIQSNQYGSFWIKQTTLEGGIFGAQPRNGTAEGGAIPATANEEWAVRFQFWFVPCKWNVNASNIAFVQIIKRTTLGGAIVQRGERMRRSSQEE